MKVKISYRVDVDFTIDLDNLSETRGFNSVDYYNEEDFKQEISIFLRSCIDFSTRFKEDKLDVTNEWIDNLPNEAYEYLRVKKEQKQLKELIQSNTATTKGKSI